MTKKYKVLHVIDHLGTGGAQEVAMNLIKFRNVDLFDCEAACLYGRGFYFEKFESLGFKVHSLSPSKHVPLYWLHFWRLIRRNRYDIIHFHLNASNILVKPIAAWCGVKVRINHDHLHDPFRYKKKLLLKVDKFTNKYSTHVLAVSQSVNDFLVEWESMPPEKVTTVINGIDIERFKPRPEKRDECLAKWNLPPDKIIVAGVGRLRYQKNFFLFLDVAQQVLQQNDAVHFVIAGDGPDEVELKAHARQLGIESKVSFLGFVPDVTELYPALDIFLMTSRFEGTPMTILEAMSCRLAIVASSVDGIAEVLKPDHNALLCDPDKADDFVENLLKLLGDKNKMKALRDNAFDLVNRNHSAQAISQKVEEIYLKYV